MTSAEIAVTAALGASLLTALGSLGVVWFQSWLGRRATRRAALHASVRELLTRSLAVAMRAQTMGETMKVRSGLIEGVDIVSHNRKPVDPMQLHDWLAADTAPLSAALDEIWLRWDQEGVRLANDVVSKCMDLVGASTATQPARSFSERARKWAAGERWTPEMLDAQQQALKDLAHARKRFADYARARLGMNAVYLFAQAQAPVGETPALPAPDSQHPADHTTND